MNISDIISAEEDLVCELCGSPSDGTGMQMHESERFDICDDCDFLMHWCLASSSNADN